MLPTEPPVEPSDAQADTSAMICEEFFSVSEMEAFETTLAEGASDANSLSEFELWLQSLPCLETVELESYVVKTFPPRREFIIGLKLKGGDTVEKVITIEIVHDDQLKFLEMRELN
ncbi:MAG: hypothetical protein GWP61_10850 [Chloroflexi bacterium]|jgi:hypothetical protein|nr:hypothetical protein [Chloroflexota bacterium]